MRNLSFLKKQKKCDELNSIFGCVALDLETIYSQILWGAPLSTFLMHSQHGKHLTMLLCKAILLYRHVIGFGTTLHHYELDDFKYKTTPRTVLLV